MTIPPDRSPEVNFSKIQHSTFKNKNDMQNCIINLHTHGALGVMYLPANTGVHLANGSSRLSNHDYCNGYLDIIKPFSAF